MTIIQNIEDVAHRRKSELTAVYLDPEIKKELEEWAKEEERSVSFIIKKLINKALAERKNTTKNDDK